MQIQCSDRLENVGYTEELSLGFQVKTTKMDLHMSSPAFCEITQKQQSGCWYYNEAVMEKWECHFQMDFPGASAVPSVGFSAAFGAFLEVLSRKVWKWQSQAVRGSWAEGGGDNAPGVSQLPARSCSEHSAEHISHFSRPHPSPCDATGPGSRVLSLLLEQAVTSNLRSFSSWYNHL